MATGKICESDDDLVKLGEEFMKKGDKSNFVFASDCFDRAATFFKRAQSWDKAGEAYVKSANCHMKRKMYRMRDNAERVNTLATAMVNAAHCYKRTSVQDAIMCLDKAISSFLFVGNITCASNCEKEVAELYEEELNIAKSCFHFEKAADLFDADFDTYHADTCTMKVAEFSVQLEQYQKAIDIYEDMARRYRNKRCYEFKVEVNLLNAGLCRLCKGDDIAAITNALERYQELYPIFPATREYRFLQDMVEVVKEKDAAKCSILVVGKDITLSRWGLGSFNKALPLKIKEILEGEKDARGIA